MSWPLSQDYNEAIQSPNSSFGDPELRGGQVVTNAMGIPMPRSGNFADVYEFQGTSGRKWAIKCFTREVPGLQGRYSEISKHLVRAKLPFTVEFEYLVRGIRIRGQFYPVLKMEWVDGFLLNEFVRNNLDKPALLEGLGQIWLRMAKRLHEADMAHADLQHGNVILVPGIKASALAVRLIDYDAMWVPALANKESGEVGHPAYQHPQRLREGIYSADVDRFPLLVVATALRGLSVGGRELWDRYDNGDNLLFGEADLQSPGKSTLFKELQELSDPQTRTLVEELQRSSTRRLQDVPAIDELFTETKATSVRIVVSAPAMVAEPATTLPGVETSTAFAPPLDFDEPCPTKPKRMPKEAITAFLMVSVLAAGILLWAVLSNSKNGTPIAQKKNGPQKIDEPSKKDDPKKSPPDLDHPKKKEPIPGAGDFITLFNGKDLTGWKDPQRAGDWRITNGVLTCSVPYASALSTMRDDYKDFHLYVEARFTGSDRPVSSCVVYRSSLDHFGYYCHITPCELTGRVLVKGNKGSRFSSEYFPSKIQSGEWFTLEVIAEGNHQKVKVNGKATTDFMDEKQEFTIGGITLFYGTNCVFEVRKIEIKELKPTTQPPVDPVVAAPLPQESFAGEWINANKDSNHLKRLAITKNGNAWSIDAWGVGGGGNVEIPWKKVGLSFRVENAGAKSHLYGFATWNFGFAVTVLTVRPEKEELFVESSTIFKDMSGRKNYRVFEKFKKKDSVP